jgi:Rrf2 family protein
MLNSRAIHGLNVIGLVASAQRHQPITTARLSRMLGLSVSYTESLMKDLKEGDLLRAHRGPGGGYQLQQAVVNLSVWDVVSCFNTEETLTGQADQSSEFLAAFNLHQQLDDIKRSFLQSYPLADVLKHMPASTMDSEVIHASSMSFHFKPIQKQALPMAPNSVFDLSNFMQLRAA